jgi:hypothetical protein
MTRARKPAAAAASVRVPPYTVVVKFPNSTREYSYLCNIPLLRQGDHVIANGCKVEVIRTAPYDSRATKWVSECLSPEAEATLARKKAIAVRLNQIAALEDAMARWKKLRSPEAKSLLTELEGLL